MQEIGVNDELMIVEDFNYPQLNSLFASNTMIGRDSIARANMGSAGSIMMELVNFRQANAVSYAQETFCILDLVPISGSRLSCDVERGHSALVKEDGYHPSLEILGPINSSGRNFFRADFEMLSRDLVREDWSALTYLELGTK